MVLLILNKSMNNQKKCTQFKKAHNNTASIIQVSMTCALSTHFKYLQWISYYRIEKKHMIVKVNGMYKMRCTKCALAVRYLKCLYQHGNVSLPHHVIFGIITDCVIHSCNLRQMSRLAINKHVYSVISKPREKTLSLI